MIQECLGKLVRGEGLSQEEVSSVVGEIVEGTATPAQVGGLLTALRMKGETPEEVAYFASAVRGHGVQIHPKVTGRMVDTCGTGGDRTKTFNVSTVAAFVAAGAGVVVAKHGNRSVTSRCGSADLLERMGFNLGVAPQRVEESVEQVGIGFMFAPTFHPAMKRVAPIRRELGVRTVFNLIGPLMNPANANAQLLGVYSADLTHPIAEAVRKLGQQEEAMVIHGLEGMDEISVAGRTRVSWLRDGGVTTRDFEPTEFGVSPTAGGTADVETLEESVDAALRILDGGERDAKREMVVANAAAAIVLGGRAGGLKEGAQVARESIDGGAALKKLEQLVKFSGGDASRFEENARRR